MKKKLYKNNKIEVRSSKIHGYGVFAKKNIKKDELLEECHYIVVDYSSKVQHFYFSWPRGKGLFEKYVIALGYGTIYNGCEPGDEHANWKTDTDNDIFEFYAVKDIKKDEEILIDYSYE